MNLFEINNALLNCVKLSSGDYVDTETGEVIDTEAIEALEMQRDDKIRNIACWIRNLDSEEKALAEQEKIFSNRKRAAHNKKEDLKGYLARVLDGQGWKNNEVQIGWRVSEAVEADANLDISKLPPVYIEYGEPKLNKKLLKTDLKNGAEIAGVHLVKRNNIQIK